MESLMSIEPNSVRVVIADENAIFRESLRRLLDSEPGVQVVGEAPDAQSAIELTTRLKPDIFVLEFALSEKFDFGEGSVTGSYLAAVRTLMMMWAPEKADIVRAFRLGAKGVVLKTSPPGVWSNSIRAVIAGQHWLGSESVAILVDALHDILSQKTGPQSSRHHGLTPRELEIVERIAHGRSNKEVGREFSIRERTVKHHLTNIFNKVGVSSRLELALFARDHHILQSTSQQ
jgi:two-component system, NarL family, nitrate/nitrite response regulator NarL